MNFFKTWRRTLAVAGTLSLIVPSLYAATTGQLTLSGIVPTLLNISISPEAGNSSLDLTTTATDKKVATVQEFSNSVSGYKILVQSLNAGKFLNSLGTGAGSTPLSYTATYDNTAFTLSATPVVAKTVASGGVHSDSSDVDISYTGQADNTMVAGTYSDTLTLTIEAN